MDHDQRTAHIIAANNTAIAEATHAPPPEIADDPGAYLEWARTRPTPPPRRAKPRPFHDRTPRTTPRPPAHQPDPAYAPARTRLTHLDDLGAARIHAARDDLGDHATYEQLVIHAAKGLP